MHASVVVAPAIAVGSALPACGGGGPSDDASSRAVIGPSVGSLRTPDGKATGVPGWAH
jgi:hypothetical protein